jgi:hypothetical protein
MKLKSALEMAEACGLETVAEAIFNIRLHAASLFLWDSMVFEINELINEWKEIVEKTEFEQSSSVRDVLEWLKKESEL